MELELVGRERDIAWLKEVVGDRLLIGQPGAGKTFLLNKLAQEGFGLFLVCDDEAALANALRDLAPPVVIVDDAHAHGSHLEAVRRIRGRSQHFDILATTWPGNRTEISEALGGLPSSRCHQLEGLPREQILAIYEQLGIVDLPPEVMRSLIDQAANKPGLAVTLGQLWLSGTDEDRKSILTGERLTEHLLSTFGSLIGEDAEPILACFALGGDRGLPMEVVANYLKRGLAAIRQVTVGLAAAGVLSEADPGRLAVVPRALRWGLVKRVFLSESATDLSFEQILDTLEGRQRESAIEAILGAVHVGGVLHSTLLHDLVSTCSRPAVWAGYAALGSSESEWVLDHAPDELVQQVVGVLLEQAPKPTLARLAALAEAAATQGGSERPSWQANAVASWIEDLAASPDDWLRRRQLLVRSLASTERSAPRRVSRSWLPRALSPLLRRTSNVDPVLGLKVRLESTLLPRPQLEELPKLWGEMRDSFADLDAETWTSLRRQLQVWIDPGSSMAGEVREKLARWMRSKAERMSQDVADRNRDSAGIQSDLAEWAERYQLHLNVNPDPHFEALFHRASSYPDDTRIPHLAAAWAHKAPGEVAAQLERLLQEAEKVGRRYRVGPVRLARILAEQVENPEEWLTAFAAGDLDAPVLEPFAERLVQVRRRDWEKTLEQLMTRSTDHRDMVSRVVLAHVEPPSALLDRVLLEAREIAPWIHTLATQRRLPLEILRKLLRHEDWRPALAAAAGEWFGGSPYGARPEIQADWRQAVLRSKTSDWPEAIEVSVYDYHLGEIFTAEPELAAQWLERRLAEPETRHLVFGPSGVLATALALLPHEQRSRLLVALAPDFPSDDIVRGLVASSPDLYCLLLERVQAVSARYAALKTFPTAAWAELAVVALQAGLDPAAIAESSFWAREGYPIAGSGLERWQAYERDFEQLAKDPRPELQELAKSGLQMARERIAEAQKHDRRREMHGFFRE